MHTRLASARAFPPTRRLRYLVVAGAALTLIATTGFGVQLGHTLERGGPVAEPAAGAARMSRPAPIGDGIYGDEPISRGHYPAAGLLTRLTTTTSGAYGSAYGDGTTPRGHYPAAGLLTRPPQ